MSTNEEEYAVSSDVIEKRAVDIVTLLANGEYDDLSYFDRSHEPTKEQVIDAWERITSIHGEFDEVADVDTLEESEESDARQVFVYFELDGNPFKTRTIFDDYGEVVSFWILRDRNTSMVDYLGDSGRIINQEVTSTFSNVLSSLTSKDDSEPVESVSDDEREAVVTVLEALDDGSVETVYERLSSTAKQDISPESLQDAWNNTVASYDGVGQMAKRDDVIEAEIDGEQTRYVAIAFTDDDEIRSFRLFDGN